MPIRANMGSRARSGGPRAARRCPEGQSRLRGCANWQAERFARTSANRPATWRAFAASDLSSGSCAQRGVPGTPSLTCELANLQARHANAWRLCQLAEGEFDAGWQQAPDERACRLERTRLALSAFANWQGWTDVVGLPIGKLCLRPPCFRMALCSRGLPTRPSTGLPIGGLRLVQWRPCQRRPAWACQLASWALDQAELANWHP